MSKATDIKKYLNETGKQFRTKVKEVESNQGSRHIRHIIQDAQKKLTNMVNYSHPSPSPATSDDEKILKEINLSLAKNIEKIRAVKDSKRKPKDV